MRLLAAALVFALTAPALAATPAAWSAERQAAARACAKASNLRDAVVPRRAVAFSDANPVDVLFVTGVWRPKHMKGAKARMLCLYDRAAKTAEVQEAIGWSVAGPPMPPASPRR